MVLLFHLPKLLLKVHKYKWNKSYHYIFSGTCLALSVSYSACCGSYVSPNCSNNICYYDKNVTFHLDMRMESLITPTSSFPASFSSAVTSSFDSPIVSSSSFVTEGM